MIKIKNILSFLLRIGISAILLILLFKFNKIDMQALINDIKGLDKPLLAAGFIIFFFVYVLGFLRWRMLLQVTGMNIDLKKLIRAFCGGIFFSIFLPSTIGGDVVRTVDLAGHTKKAKAVVATVFLDRLSGYMGLVFVILPALLFGRNLVLDQVVFSSVFVIIMLLVVILLVLFNNFIYQKITKFLSTPGAGKIKEMLKDLHQEIHIFRNHKKMIIGNLGLSFLIQLIAPVSIYFIALSLGVKVSLIYFFIFVPIIGAITLLPVSIGGSGLREWLFVLYFAKKAGVMIEQSALVMSLLSFSFVVFYAAIGGLVYVLTVHHRRLQPRQPSGV